jgi:hypothetical protein
MSGTPRKYPLTFAVGHHIIANKYRHGLPFESVQSRDYAASAEAYPEYLPAQSWFADYKADGVS